jgi:hypothetical protein
MISIWLLLDPRQLLRARAFSCRPAQFTRTTRRTVSMLVVAESDDSIRADKQTTVIEKGLT